MVGLRSDYEPRSDRWLVTVGLWIFNRTPMRWFGLLLMRQIAEHSHFCAGCASGMNRWAHLGVEEKCPMLYVWRCGSHKE